MWYEHLYSGVITWGLLCAAYTVSGPGNWLDTGRWQRRHTSYGHKIEFSKRDHRLTGNQYRISGLESIKDA